MSEKTDAAQAASRRKDAGEPVRKWTAWASNSFGARGFRGSGRMPQLPCERQRRIPVTIPSARMCSSRQRKHRIDKELHEKSRSHEGACARSRLQPRCPKVGSWAGPTRDQEHSELCVVPSPRRKRSGPAERLSCECVAGCLESRQQPAQGGRKDRTAKAEQVRRRALKRRKAPRTCEAKPKRRYASVRQQADSSQDANGRFGTGAQYGRLRGVLTCNRGRPRRAFLQDKTGREITNMHGPLKRPHGVGHADRPYSPADSLRYEKIVGAAVSITVRHLPASPVPKCCRPHSKERLPCMRPMISVRCLPRADEPAFGEIRTRQPR